jgi:hypothetical protein
MAYVWNDKLLVSVSVANDFVSATGGDWVLGFEVTKAGHFTRRRSPSGGHGLKK